MVTWFGILDAFNTTFFIILFVLLAHQSVWYPLLLIPYGWNIISMILVHKTLSHFSKDSL